MSGPRKCDWCEGEAETTHYVHESMTYAVCHACSTDLKTFDCSMTELRSLLRQVYAHWVKRWAGEMTYVISPDDLLAQATGLGNVGTFEDEIADAFAAAGILVELHAGEWVIVGRTAA